MGDILESFINVNTCIRFTFFSEIDRSANIIPKYDSDLLNSTYISSDIINILLPSYINFFAISTQSLNIEKNFINLKLIFEHRKKLHIKMLTKISA